MLTKMLGQHPKVFAFTGEGSFFEHVQPICSKSKEGQIRWIARNIGGDSEVIASHLRKEKRDTAFSRYAESKNVIAERSGANQWVQKATSYIFQVDLILEVFPEAKILFLIRNPLDLAASLQRRGKYESHLGRMMWGWKTGVEHALEWESNHPNSVRIFRYEDLVQDTESEIRKISKFFGISFDYRCTKVTHVNPSEKKYEEIGEQKEPDSSRVYYYQSVLSSPEEMAVRILMPDDHVSTLYPNLPTPSVEISFKNRIRASRLFITSFWSTFVEHVGMIMDDPEHAIRRVRKRVFE